jgi:hypothetical protein
VKQAILGIAVITILTILLAAAGCEKEKIVESTEYIEHTEYVELPPDTITMTDTVYQYDSVTVHSVDTIVQNNYIYDTVTITDTIVTVEHHYDTVTSTQYIYDTTHVTDTVLVSQNEPNEATAAAALHYHSDPLVLDFINQEFGIPDGWVFYVSTYQMEIIQRSAAEWDFAGFIDYWTTDWSGYYALEFGWRLTYTGGDPANPTNWELSEPAAAPGLRVLDDTDVSHRLTP